MASRYQNFIKGIGLVPNAADANSKKGDLNVVSGDGKLYYHNGISSSPSVTEVHASQGANRLKNKDLEDATTAIVDSTDTTKKIIFDAAGTTGTSTTLLSSQTTNKILTLPNATDTLVGKETSDVFKNKTLDFDTGTTGNVISNIPDGALTANVMLLNAAQTVDGAKSFDVGTFLLNGATSGSTTINAEAIASGIIVVPAANDTLVGKATTDTFTNKTFDTADVGNVLKINTVQVTDVTGTGKVVLDTSPTLTTPTVDQINGATGGTLLIQSANNEDVSIQAQGTGIISIGNFDINGTSIGLNVSDVISLNAKIALPLSLDSSAGSNVLLSEPITSYIGLNAAGTLVSIGGVDGTHDGEVLYISNNTGVAVTVLNEDSSIAATKRILTGSDDDIVLEDNASIALIYNDTENRWMIVGGTGGALTVKALAGENITKGQAVYISTGTGSDAGRTAGRVYLLNAANDDRVEFVGIASNNAISGANATIQVAGQIKGLSGLTAGKPVFANPTTPGAFTMTAPIAANQWIIPVGIAVTSSILSINGAGSATAVKITSEVVDGLYADVQTYTANQTLTNANSIVLVDATSGVITITLPAPARGKIFNIKKTDSSANAVTISPPSGTIDGAANKSLDIQYESLTITSDGTNFFII